MGLCPVRNEECEYGDCEWWVDLEELNPVDIAVSFEGGCAIKAIAIITKNS